MSRKIAKGHPIWEDEEKSLNIICNEVRKKLISDQEYESKRIEDITNIDSFDDKEKQQDISHSLNRINDVRDSLSDYEKILKRPYILHYVLKEKDDIPMEIYLSNEDIKIQNIVDEKWMMSLLSRNEGPLAKKIVDNFYTKNLGDVTFGDNIYEYKTARKVFIENSKLRQVVSFLESISMDYDSENIPAKNEKKMEISDIFLKEVLEKNRNTPGMGSIIESIQKKQYEIIRFEPEDSFIVQGCAGSGKTVMMMHRLVFLKRDPKLKNQMDRVLIITPNKVLMESSQDFKANFQLNNISEQRLEEYYWELLQEYNSKLFNEESYYVDSDYSKLAAEYINTTYNNENMEDAKFELLCFIVETNQELVKHDVKVVFDDQRPYEKIIPDIKDDIDRLLAEHTDYRDSLKKSEKYLDMKEKIRIEKRKLQNTNANIRRNTKQLHESAVTFAEKSMETLEPEEDTLDSMLPNLEGIIARIKKHQNHREELLDNISQMEKDMQNFDFKGKTVQEINNFSKEDKELKELKKLLNNYFEELCIGVLGESFGYGRFSEDNKRKINRYEMSVYVYLCRKFYGNKKAFKNKLICIDEAQNLNLIDYENIKALEPEAAFNIYGDVSQKLYKEVGMMDLRNAGKYHYLVFNENYRNPKPIVKYCNNNLKLEMRALGLDGENVIRINPSRNIKGKSEKDFVRYILCKQKINEGIIIIVKDMVEFKRLKFEIGNKIGRELIFVDSDYDPKSSNINVFPIDKAIGMEFENVVVCPNNMTRNQKYIAYTRATKELVLYELY